ncbi:ATPase PAAT [Neolamprologus brichardi]|uniref:ATPase PAAT n=1 Tax=Neolamprologus brichardi TaxID=32507 RepID=UPI001643EA16|nr:ATPase PAAT [Neolamprologus brichardi]
MVDISVKSEATWVCHTQGRHLADVVLPVHINNTTKEEDEVSELDREETQCCDPVLLEQMEEGSPCVLKFHCNPSLPATISRLLVISEARTMEVYSQTGEYSGTVRGSKDDSIQLDSADRGPFYKKQLIIEEPSSACEVKLLSLAGRSSVMVAKVIVSLQLLQSCPAPNPGIDMQRVQCLMEEMGTSLSPGAQNLMEMVQFQQKNQTGSLAGFLPLLMGSGAFSGLGREVSMCPGAGNFLPRPAEFKVQNPFVLFFVLRLDHLKTRPTLHFLKGQGVNQGFGSSPELLPMLQNVCGQVTQLRLDDAAAEKEKMMRNGTWELDSAMERRLEEMEKRLKEHMDRRLDALEQKLEKALLSALPLVTLNHGAMSSSARGAADTGPAEQIAPTPAMH